MATAEHNAALRQLGLVSTLLAGLAGATYLHPAAAELRPWIPGEPVPLLHLLAQDAVVRETTDGELVRVASAPAPEPGPLAGDGLASAEPTDSGGPPPPLVVLPERPPAVATPLDVPAGALDRWFYALAAVEDGQPGRIARALHWGDSTIAADGLTGTVRTRLQARFGDGGPGFLAVHVDPQWSLRPGVARWPKGEWQTFTITFAGAPSARYGLAGTVSTTTTEASSTLGGLKVGEDRQPLARFDLFYQTQPEGGTISLKARGGPGATLKTAADSVGDRFYELKAPAGASTLWVGAAGDGPVAIYGVALETAGPGVTWESFGVAGSSIASLSRQGRAHLAGQVSHRDPDLMVYMTGGNELGYPNLSTGEGEGYRDAYRAAVQKLRKGAPEASCLLVGPLDQGTRSRGAVVSKTNLNRMIGLQKQVAVEEGCAYWDARAAMGGEGSFSRWLDHDPRYAWTDLIHLTDEGLDILGNSFADAILGAFDAWRVAHADAGWTAEETPAEPVPAPDGA